MLRTRPRKTIVAMDKIFHRHVFKPSVGNLFEISVLYVHVLEQHCMRSFTMDAGNCLSALGNTQLSGERFENGDLLQVR